VPPLVFAFFDPVKETYVTCGALRSRSRSKAGGPECRNSSGGCSHIGRADINGGRYPCANSKATGHLYQLIDLGRIRSFTPIYARPVFWIAQLASFILLLGFVGWKIRQAKIDNLEATHRSVATGIRRASAEITAR